jgi:thiamine-phosphate pyrophosphorylase
MFDTTAAVGRALEAARLWAVADQAAVGAAHLLQGLLAEEEGRAWLLLGKAGVDPQSLRRPAPPESLEEPPLDAAARDALVRARALARGLGEEASIASEHLLFALLEGDITLRQQLEAAGLRFEVLEAEIHAAQGPPIQLDEPLRLDEPEDTWHTARLLDAAANRAREALRVLEDHARFNLNDAMLSGELKRLRHGLVDALVAVPAAWLLQGRDTLGDVGTTISTPREQHRGSLQDVIHANCKRLQEALRSLEEYGKLHGGELAATVEALRYRAYSVERTLLLGSRARERLAGAQLYVLVTGQQCPHGVPATVRAAVAGGAQVIQLRAKHLADRELLALAREVRRLTREAGALFIVNDRPDLARLCEADGVHLGQDDLPVGDARRILGPDALVGVSTHDLEQLRRAVLEGADYVGVGPTFPSTTKVFAALAGLDYVRQAVAETSLPAFALGGITAENLPQVLAAGARRVAVSAAVCRADDPRAATEALVRVLQGGGQEKGCAK